MYWGLGVDWIKWFDKALMRLVQCIIVCLVFCSDIPWSSNGNILCVGRACWETGSSHCTENTSGQVCIYVEKHWFLSHSSHLTNPLEENPTQEAESSTVQKYTVFYGNWRFVNSSREFLPYPILTWMYAIHILTPHLFKIYFSIFTIFISPLLIPSRFLIKIV